MLRIKTRKGLSPLVATVVLISATIIGGMLVYQYFQNSVTKAQNMAEGVTITASSIQLDNGKTLISITISNGYDTRIQITGAKAILPDGSISSLQPTNDTTLPITILPGDKNTLLFVSDNEPQAVTIEYEANGQSYQSEPISIG